MTGMAKLTYWLGWLSLALAVIGRILLLTGAREHMVAASVLPRNFAQLTVIFFLASIASYTCQRSSQA